MTDTSVKTHVLLIGINHYQPNRFYRDLKGCIHDVNLVDEYLQTSLQIPSDNIYRLTSPSPEENSLADVRSASPDPLPTYENIIQAFAQVTDAAQPGEQVYIHYSGHGGRASTLYPELKGTGQNDEGLVPSDIGTSKRYVRDVEMATLLKRMTDKGLVVTMILDSCHSGGATRGDYAIRGSNEVDGETDSAESLVAPRDELMATWRSLTSGQDASNWLPNSREYVVLAACRPSEFAFEYAVSGEQRHGALTYWMIDTLSNSSVPNLDYRSLHERISAKIQSRFPNQLPMLMGEEKRLVLGTDIAQRPYAVSTLGCDLKKQEVQLKAGLAQGMSRGSRFAIYPFGTQDFSDAQSKLAIVDVNRIEATSCFAKIIPATEGGIDVNAQLSSLNIAADQLAGAPAVMESTPTDLQRRVRIFAAKQIGTGENELPAELADQQQAALEKVRQAIADNGWVREANSDEEAHYQVAIAPTGDYEICIGLPLKNLRPPLPLNDPNAATTVVERLVHLAKYQAVQELDNPKSGLSRHLGVELLTQPGWQPGEPINPEPFPDPQNISLASGSIIFLKLINRYPSDLNIAVLDITPTWEVGQLPIAGLSGALYSMASKEEQIIPLQISLPSSPDDKSIYTTAKETLKVFATLGPADFSWLELPPLDNPVQSKGSPMRGGSPLSQLLEAMGAEKPTTTRAISLIRDPNQDWTTKQIHITITQ
ncbi:MAG: caspase domain-containing protein [Phormidesmis sp.]